jgi:D-inositol-3-phosphate glycosyltransferase
MFCDSTLTDVPPQGSRFRRALARLRKSIRNRAGLRLGAPVAIHNLYAALLEHYGGEGILLVPTPRAETVVRQEVSWLTQQGRIGRTTRVADIIHVARAAADSQTHWFEPHCIRPELLDIRQAFLRRPIPITWTHHTVSYRETLGQVFLPLLLSESLPCDSIVCSSRAARTAISNILEMVASRLSAPRPMYKGRFDYIPFGVNTEQYRPIEQSSCRRVFGLPLDATIVLCLGRISASDKGDLLPLAMAIRQVRAKSGKRVLLLIAGNSRGNYADLLRNKIHEWGLADSVRFVRYVSESEKPFLYAAADIFVSPSDSIQESFGLVLLEAMACGIPQVVSDWDGYRDLVVHGQTGFLVPTTWAECDDLIVRNGLLYSQDFELDHFQLGQSVCVDIRALSNALLELVNNRELRLHMSAASRARAEAVFDWRKIVRKYEELWTDLDNIALTLPDLGSSQSYRVPSYYRCFKHYATATLTEASWLSWDESCTSPDGNGILLPYRELFQGVDPFAGWNTGAIISLVKNAKGRLQVGVQVGELFHLLRADGERSEILRQVMWLLKYGYLRVLPYPKDEALVSTVASEALDESLAHFAENR